MVKLMAKVIYKEEILMKKNFLIKFGAPVLALSLVTACGTDDNEDPVNEEAPLIQEDDNGEQNEMEENNNGDMNENDNGGMNGNDDGGMNGGNENGEGGTNGNENGGTDTDGGLMEDGTNEDTMDEENNE